MTDPFDCLPTRVTPHVAVDELNHRIPVMVGPFRFAGPEPIPRSRCGRRASEQAMRLCRRRTFASRAPWATCTARHRDGSCNTERRRTRTVNRVSFS